MTSSKPIIAMCVARATQEENRAEMEQEQSEQRSDYYSSLNTTETDFMSSNSTGGNDTLELEPLPHIPRTTYIYIYTGECVRDRYWRH